MGLIYLMTWRMSCVNCGICQPIWWVMLGFRLTPWELSDRLVKTNEVSICKPIRDNKRTRFRSLKRIQRRHLYFQTVSTFNIWSDVFLNVVWPLIQPNPITRVYWWCGWWRGLIGLNQLMVQVTKFVGRFRPPRRCSCPCYICSGSKGFSLSGAIIREDLCASVHPGTPFGRFGPLSWHFQIDQRVRSKFHGPLKFYETGNA